MPSNDTSVTDRDLESLDAFAEQNRQSAKLSEVMAGPPSAIQRSAIYTIALALLFGLGVLYFGKVHVVVTAKGKVVPEGESLMVQALDGGYVTEVLANVGDRLAAGAPLLRMDEVQSGLNLEAIRRKLALQETSLADLRQAEQVLGRVIANPGAVESVTEVVPAGGAVDLINALKKATLDLRNARAVTQDDFGERKLQMLSEAQTSREKIDILTRGRKAAGGELARQEQDVERKRARLEERRGLVTSGVLSASAFEDEQDRFRGAEMSLVENRRRLDQLDIDLAAEKVRLADLQLKTRTEEGGAGRDFRGARSAYEQSLASVREGYVSVLAQIRSLETDVANTRGELAKAENEVRRTSVVMPVAGTVVKSEVKNPGEIITPGKLIAAVVPDGAPLIVTASVPNKDIGFVKVGLPVQIKVDAYPFQQFGTMVGRVMKVYPNVEGEETFEVSIELLEMFLRSGDRTLPLFPGLSVQAELLTDEQRIIDLLLNK